MQLKDLKTFVRNRVNEINSLNSGFIWMHVLTSENPADSRGVNSHTLRLSSLWWEGPSSLKREKSEWPQLPSTTPFKLNLPNLKTKSASNELSRVLRSSRHSVLEFSANEVIKFNFKPACAPHFGGIWEAGIKSAKFHLKRIDGNFSLTFEELATLFTQIEAILNSRPSSPLSSEPTDLSPLTPGHFLLGRSLISVPSLSVTSSRTTRYKSTAASGCGNCSGRAVRGTDTLAAPIDSLGLPDTNQS
ncbi:hypothetical protein EVAR_66542_1 [Eumeta japonica]|uniref:Uncharacterized protein n=1 Tax=Eumeta variegata TaxID=151549 RepID=A0A4C2A2A7_EUMVA|nr:hypothetical protein EVAR_66542_1 [Eumeta japonica]